MRTTKSMRALTASICCFGILQPTLALGSEPVSAAPVAVATPLPPVTASVKRSTTIDVELNVDHNLAGQLVNQSGVPIASAPVAIWQRGRLIQTTMTNAKGEYRLAHLSSGNYQIDFGHRALLVRCWTSGDAPPNSIASLRTTADEEVVRAQQRSGAVCGVVNPWVIAGGTVAAIAIPVALHNNREDRPASD